MRIFAYLTGKPFFVLWHQVSFILLPVFCTSSHSPNRNREINQSWKRVSLGICLCSEKGHVTIFACLELSALALQNQFYSINYRLEQLSVGKVYYFRVHCASSNTSLLEGSKVNQVKTACDCEHIVIEILLS